MSCLRKLEIIFGALCALIFLPSSTVCLYQLTVPPEYTAFSGDLEVFYKLPEDVSLSHAFIRVAFITDSGDEEVTNLDLDYQYKNGKVKLTCGIIEVAGKYEFQMYMYVGGPLLARAALLVRWPDILLQLSDTHFAQSSSVRLKINSSAVCNPLLKRYDFKIELDYATNNSAISVTGTREILYSHPFEDFSGDTLFVEFPCSLFDLPGIYRASLISSYSAISVVSRSNLMTTSLNPAYRINIWTNTIFPCHDTLEISYNLPQCPGVRDNNRIRIYMLRRKSSGSLAAPIEKEYKEERLAAPDKTSFKKSCSEFDTVAVGYCFQFVTFARHGLIINQTELCLSAHPDSVLPVDGGWSAWSVWSECSTTCGSGQQSRYRMCNSPTPNFGGAFCEGDSIQTKDCDIFCPDSIPMTPLHSPRVDEACKCGCHMTEDKGQIIASGRCTLSSKWLISVKKDHYIKLKFSYLNLYQNKQWVKVRNGAQVDSDLIAFSDGRSEINHVTSTTNEMLIEFFTEPDNDGNRNIVIYPMAPTKAIHVHGFIASFESNRTEGVASTVAAQPVKVNKEPSIWESTVTIVGIALCGLVVITAISFAIYHRTCHRRQHKYAMAAHEESPKRMCKSTSMSSPSHSSHHGIEIENDMQIPLTGVMNGADKKRAKTPGSAQSKSSFSSTCSNKVKMLRTKADIEHGSSFRASPLTPSRDYAPISQDTSPRRKHRVRELTQESENNMSLFRTSPLMKTKVPRSPKVHPSPKLKKPKPSSANNESSDTSRTKRDMLTKRFGNYEHERVVMGSDHTPTNSVKSPPSDSVKTDCETPTNIDHDMYKKHARHKNDKECERTNQREILGDINLKDLSKSNENIERNPASGTSDDSTSAEKVLGSQMTTSFIENGVKPRRPTSLTESYSKMSLASALSRASTEGAGNGPESSKDKSSVHSSDDRQNALPKPDGQSPKSQRIETVKAESKNASPSKTSKASTPRSVRSLRSDQTDNSSNTKSPARSINTPSDVQELEYDDFIDMDDTYSYFDPIVTEQLTFHGVERVTVKKPKTPKSPKTPLMEDN